jgi:hypothetical protein
MSTGAPKILFGRGAGRAFQKFRAGGLKTLTPKSEGFKILYI